MHPCRTSFHIGSDLYRDFHDRIRDSEQRRLGLGFELLRRHKLDRAQRRKLCRNLRVADRSPSHQPEQFRRANGAWNRFAGGDQQDLTLKLA